MSELGKSFPTNVDKIKSEVGGSESGVLVMSGTLEEHNISTITPWTVYQAAVARHDRLIATFNDPEIGATVSVDFQVKVSADYGSLLLGSSYYAISLERSRILLSPYIAVNDNGYVRFEPAGYYDCAIGLSGDAYTAENAMFADNFANSSNLESGTYSLLVEDGAKSWTPAGGGSSNLPDAPSGSGTYILRTQSQESGDDRVEWQSFDLPLAPPSAGDFEYYLLEVSSVDGVTLSYTWTPFDPNQIVPLPQGIGDYILHVDDHGGGDYSYTYTEFPLPDATVLSEGTYKLVCYSDGSGNISYSWELDE